VDLDNHSCTFPMTPSGRTSRLSGSDLITPSKISLRHQKDLFPAWPLRTWCRADIYVGCVSCDPQDGPKSSEGRCQPCKTMTRCDSKRCDCDTTRRALYFFQHQICSWIHYRRLPWRFYASHNQKGKLSPMWRHSPTRKISQIVLLIHWRKNSYTDFFKTFSTKPELA